MIKLISDSTGYIPEDFIKQHNIKIIPLSVILGEEVIVETEITNEKFFHKLDNSEHHPTSSQPNISVVYDEFEKHIKNGDSVVYTCISSKMSGTYSSGLLVKDMILEKYPDAKIEIIDSQSNCMQAGYATLAGAEQIENGSGFKQVVNSIHDTIEKTRMLFIPDTLKYLQKSGRLTKAKALAANVLKIVPILTVIEGKADVFKKIRTRRKALDTILQELIDDIKEKKVTAISVIHINNEGEAFKLIEKLKELINIDINIASIGPVIGAHVGPGAVGVVWCNA